MVDRYCASGVAYGLDINCCKAMESKILKPDLTLFFSIPVRVAIIRAGFGLEKFETVKYQREVLLVYHQIRDCTWVTMDATKSKQKITDEVRWHVLNFLSTQSAGMNPLSSD